MAVVMGGETATSSESLPAFIFVRKEVSLLLNLPGLLNLDGGSLEFPGPSFLHLKGESVRERKE